MSKQKPILVSACLLGINCKYDGKSKHCKKAIELFKKGKAIPICPEQLGGLPTPRTPQEIQNGDGSKVLDGKVKVKNKKGKDVTPQFVRGAKEALKIAKMTKAKKFIGKSKSPSCGCGKTYDGTFSGTLIKADGVTTALFKRNRIEVITDKELEKEENGKD